MNNSTSGRFETNAIPDQLQTKLVAALPWHWHVTWSLDLQKHVLKNMSHRQIFNSHALELKF